MSIKTAKCFLSQPDHGRRTSRSLLKLSSIFTSLAIATLPLMAQAGVLPSGGQVVAGDAHIASNGSTTTVTQGSQYVVVNWDAFSVGKGSTVDFKNGSGATLNRVTGSQVSNIDGTLSATGSVYLINANGVVVGTSGVIKTGGSFVASTQNVSDADFLNGGGLSFAGTSKNAVVNLGQISANGGNIALIAERVENAGTLTANSGTVGLAAGYNVVLSDSNQADGLLQVQIGGAEASVRTTGAISASMVELRAQGGNLYALAGNTEGLIQAKGVATKGGQIFLTAGEGGKVTIDGTTLTATDKTGNGGTIAVTGQTVIVGANAVIDTSATSATGKGGDVRVIGGETDGSLSFKGQALAKGGATGGDGGFIETSAAQVDFTGARMDASAAKGTTGTWLVDPVNLTVDAVAATTISNNLATANVTLQTTATGATGPGVTSSGNGDILINSALSWDSANTLTLDAYHSVAFNANVTVTGSGGVVIHTNHGGTGGDYSFARGSSLQFTGNEFNVSPSLTINGDAYTLIHTLDELSYHSYGGDKLALANAIVDTTVHSGSIITAYSGIFTGLGNTISNLNINGTWQIALVGASSGTVRDIGLLNANLTATGGYTSTGALIAENTGTVQNAWATGAVDEQATWGSAGGLVGFNSGTITDSTADVHTKGINTGTGGLVGTNAAGGAIIRSGAIGQVEGVYQTGGLVGENRGTVTKSYAMGDVSGTEFTGGLAGLNNSDISFSYATGDVVGNDIVGGLVGVVDPAGTISQSFATGDVSSTRNDGGQALMGGLVGINNGNVSDTFAIGSVSAANPTALIGGLVGLNNATLSNSYALGAIQTNGGYAINGAIGANGGTVTNVYYNADTSGQPAGTLADGNVGMTTADLLGILPTGFSGSTWTISNGIYPMLTNIDSSHFSVVGGNLQSSGSTTGASINLYSNGALNNGNAVTASANGTYYALVTDKALSGADALGGTVQLAGAASATGLNYVETPTAVNHGYQLDLVDGEANLVTSQTSLSVLRTKLVSTFGANPLTGLTSANLAIRAKHAFTIDGAISQTGTVNVQADGGNLTIASGGSVMSTAAGQSVTLAANGAFINNGGANAVKANAGTWLIYSQAYNAPTTLPAGTTTGGLNGKGYYGDVFDFATSTFASTPNSGNRFVYGTQPTLHVGADTASLEYNGAVQTVGATTTGYVGNDASTDTLTGTVSGLTTSGKNAGTYALTAAGILVSDENYAIVYDTRNVVIAPKALNSALTGWVSKTYDGTTTANVALNQLSVSGIIAGDDVSVDAIVANYGDKNAGTNKTVNVTSVTLGGNDAANYTIGTASGNIGEITKASLTLSALTDTRTYNGTTTSTVAPGITGLQTGDSVTGLSQSFDSQDAGTRTLSVNSGWILNDGNNGGNYVVTTQTAAGTITPMALTWVTYQVGDATYVYGQTPTTGAVTLNGVLPFDAGEVSGVLGIFSGNTQISLTDRTNVGTYSEQVIGLTGDQAFNYSIQASGNTNGVLRITPAILTANLIGSVSKNYDGTTLADLTSANFSLSGVLSGDDVSLLTPPNGQYGSRNTGSNIEVTASNLGLTGAASGNYRLDSATTAALIGQIGKASVTVSADDLMKFYGQSDPTFTYSVSGLLGDDALSGALSRTAGEGAGTYAINLGTLGSQNYAVTLTPGTFTILAPALQNQGTVFPTTQFDVPPPFNLAALSQTTPANTGDCATGQSCQGSPYPDNLIVSDAIVFESH